MRLRDSVALITGGASGIGLAVARRFTDEGAKVAIMDRSVASLESARIVLPDVLTVAGDLTVFGDNVRAVNETLRVFGRLDTFIGNAGIFDHYMTLDELPTVARTDHLACSSPRRSDRCRRVSRFGRRPLYHRAIV